jgi:hypothetical protein
MVRLEVVVDEQNRRETPVSPNGGVKPAAQFKTSNPCPQARGKNSKPAILLRDCEGNSTIRKVVLGSVIKLWRLSLPQQRPYSGSP